MTQAAKRPKLVALALTTALASATLGGCATNAAPRAETSAGKAEAALAKGQSDRAVVHAEAAVLAEPRNAAYRSALGATYMQAGRFDAAATSFADALELGDNSARTALSFALASIAVGNNPQALAALSDHRSAIAPADMGLALALAGQADRGVAILGQALRQGHNTAKLRQNLAYAYALQGSWRAARVMAAEDVPADMLDVRISDWASTSKPEDHRKRVAKLLQAPVVGDPGQPAQLALNLFPSQDMMVAEAAARMPDPAPAAAPAVLAGGELPAITDAAAPQKAAASDYALPPLAKAEPKPEPVAVEISGSASAKPANFTAAFNAPVEAALEPAALPTGATFAQVATSAVRFVSNPMVQATPKSAERAATAPTTRRVAERTAEPRVSGRTAQASAPAAKPAPKAAPKPAAAQAAMSTDGDHLIQLGSYANKAQAQAGWKTLTKRYPQLGKFEMVITEAEVRGKTYFRVSAGGFKRGDARSMCSTLKAKGQGCIAWADGKPLPGALKRTERLARR